MSRPLSFRVLDLLRGRNRSRRAREPFTDLDALAAHLGRPVRVAVARFDGLGDWVLTLPAVEALRAHPAVASVAVVAPEAHRGLLAVAGVAFVGFSSGTILDPPSPGGTVGKVLASSRIGRSRARRTGEQSRGDFDLVVLPRWDTDFGLNARAWAVGSGARIIGHHPAAVPDSGAGERREIDVMDVVVRDDRPAAHDMDHLVPLVARLGVGIEVPGEAGRGYFGVSERGRPTSDAPVVIHPAANEPKRQWPVERWRELIAGLPGVVGDRPVLLVGAPAERVVHEEIAAGFPQVRSLAGELPLRELPAQLADAYVFVGNDSGPAHIAASVGTPTVVISPHPAGGDPTHRNSPERFAPRGSAVAVVRPAAPAAGCTDACIALHPHCIRNVTVDQVLPAVRSVLD